METTNDEIVIAVASLVIQLYNNMLTNINNII